MSTQMIDLSMSEVLLSMRRRPRKNLTRRMCDECLTGQHARCETVKCPCKCNEMEERLAA